MKIKVNKVDSKELCRLAFKLYEENNDELKNDFLKKNLQQAYENIPKSKRKYVLGDMNLHDGPIRDVVYGEHNIINWDYKKYINDNGELDVPVMCDNKNITIPNIMRHFRVGYARAVNLLKELKTK